MEESFWRSQQDVVKCPLLGGFRKVLKERGTKFLVQLKLDTPDCLILAF
jgi:hypothetical protein